MTQRPWGTPPPPPGGVPPMPQYGRGPQGGAPTWGQPGPVQRGQGQFGQGQPGQGQWDPTQPLGGQPAGTPPPAGRAPLGPPPPERVTIEQFRSPRQRLPWWVVALAALLALGLVAWGASSLLSPTSSSSASPTPSRANPASPSGSATGTSSTWIAEDRGAEGTWHVEDERWSGDRVTVKITIECTKGETPVQFFAITSATPSEQYDATTGAAGQQPNLNGTRVRAGDRVEGYVTLLMPRQKAALIMGSSTRRAIAGVELNG